jgi:hypothetical protein
MQERRQARAKALHEILDIRPDQEAAFQTFVTSMRPPEGGAGIRPHGMDDEGAMAQLTTPERLDRMAQRMAERQSRFQQHAAAVKAFYATLSPQQKRAFDALPGLMGMGGHREGGWRDGGPRFGGRGPKG